MRKIISLVLTVALLITFMAPVMAAESTTTADKGLEAAIKAVKAKIEIPTDCTKFSYNFYTQDSRTIWNFTWSNEKTHKFVNVSIDNDNFISNYNCYQYSYTYDKKLPKYSKAQGKDIAEKFVAKLDSKILTEYKSVENTDYNQDREYYFNYVRQVNGINFNTDTMTVSVNNSTGEIANYYCNYSKNITFEDASKLIGLESAKKVFMEKLGLKLVYNLKSENNKYSSYLVYVPKDSNKYIDAITGEVNTNPYSYGVYYSSDMLAKSEAGFSGNTALTPDEMNAVNDMSGLLTKEQVDSKIRAISLFKVDSDFKQTSFELRKDWRNDGTLIWNANYNKVIDADTNQTKNISVAMDAKTGDIINFWTYYPAPTGAKPQKTRDEVKKLCDDAIKSLMPNYYAKLKFDDTYYSYNSERLDTLDFRYVRVENGIEVPTDYLTISYDNLTGNVTSVYSNWTKDVKFEDPKTVITLDKAYDTLFNKIGYGVEYIIDNTQSSEAVKDKIAVSTATTGGKAVLGYFVNSRKPCFISAATGELLNYMGNSYKENIVVDYTDIKGLSAENKIRILTQMSIRYNENQLKANESLLQKDYFMLLSRLNDIYYFDSGYDQKKNINNMYDNLINSGIITAAEKAPDSTVTREDAAKFFVKFLRLNKVAEIKGIYKSGYKDEQKINSDLLGYVCIASGLKAFSGNKGYFNPKAKMTRLDALMVIYDYLNNK